MINDAERYGKAFLGDFYGDLAVAEEFECTHIFRNIGYWQETISLWKSQFEETFNVIQPEGTSNWFVSELITRCKFSRRKTSKCDEWAVHTDLCLCCASMSFSFKKKFGTWGGRGAGGVGVGGLNSFGSSIW